MVSAEVDRRSKLGIRRYACAAATRSHYGPTMAATNRERSQGGSRDSITRGRRRSLVYLTLGMAFTESKAYNAGAPWLYHALVFIFTDIEDSFFEKKIMYTQYLVAYAGHITSVNLHVTV